MARRPPAVCTSCFADLHAAACTCGLPRAEVVWVPFAGGVGPWCLRIAFGLFIMAIAAFLLASCVILWFGAHEPGSSRFVQLVLGAVALGGGLFMLGLANAIWFGHRWDYQSADGLTSGWVVRLFGGIFEGGGEHGVSAALSVSPACEVDSGVLGLTSSDMATGLASTVLGLAARGRVVLRRVERRSLSRPPNWPLSLGWWRARTRPQAGAFTSRLEIAAVSTDDDRWLERALLSVLPEPRSAGAQAEHYRAPPGRGEPADFVPFSEALIDWMVSVQGPTAARLGATSDPARTRVRGVADAERALAAARAMDPSMVGEIEGAAADVLACLGE